MDKSGNIILDRWLTFVDDVKEDLALNEYPFDDIDPAFILQVLTWKGANSNPSNIVRELIKKSQIPSADELEFIGDGVLHIIFTMSVAKYPLSVGNMTKFRSELERNSNLFIYATELDLCRGMNQKIVNPRGKMSKNPNQKSAMKSCADIFESLIGAMYIHLFYGKSMRYNAIEYIEIWLDNLGYEDMLKDLVEKINI
jgi:dsRNA-specific ribonuclease